MSRKIDYDFTVEYAKSSRSSCKTCKNKIEKDQLRLGQMVQSPHFDGKIPMWHHFKCFFAKGNKGLTDFAMLHNRNAIRPDDQDKVRTKIDSFGEGSGKKRKEREDDDASSSEPKNKKKKVLSKEEKLEEALREETRLLWEIKDNLKKELNNSDLREILELNNQPTAGGEHKLLSRVANGMLFGALPKCPQCKSGNLFYAGDRYRCSGFADAWGRCLYEATTIKPKKWKFPKWKSEVDYLKKYKIVHRTKVMKATEVIKAEIQSMEVEAMEGSSNRSNRPKPFDEIGTPSTTPLEGTTISSAGSLGKNQKAIKALVEELGGTWSSSVTVSVTHLISSPETVKSNPKKVKDATQYDIPIMSLDWLVESETEKKKLDQSKYIIGGSEQAKKTMTFAFSAPKAKAQEEEEKKVKLVMKGRAAVDPLAGEAAVTDYHILDEGGSAIYDVVLNCCDVVTGINSYYGLQLLEVDKGKKKQKYQIFRKWGRVATNIGSSKLDGYSTKASAKDMFEKVYLDKTGNEWSDRDKFEKQPGRFFPIEIDYSQDDGEEDAIHKASKLIKETQNSKLAKSVQNLISLIFDIKLMESSLIEMEVDLKKMPLGKLSKRHIQGGYDVLKKIEQILNSKDSEKKKEQQLVSLTSQFYTRIPHDFGMESPKIIDSMEALKDKQKLMEALIDIEIATSMLKEGSSTDCVVDANYEKLKTDIVPVEPGSEDFEMIQTYINNQKAQYKVSIKDIFKIERDGSTDRYETKKDLGNRQLLWHGSRVTNYCGILSQGLRIAPPEAPKSGYRFGKGVYFADIFEKSAGYCRGVGSDTILMMLVEVALGKPKELTRDKYMEKPQPGSDSTKAMGYWVPNPKSTITVEDGEITVPLGKPEKTAINSSCWHNEYIIYNVAQARIRYLIRMDLN